MKRIISILLANVVLFIGLNLLPQKSFAAEDYSGGLLSGLSFYLSSDESASGTLTSVITDNNEATSITMTGWDKGTNKDHLVKTLASTISTNYLRLKASGGVWVAFFNSAGVNITPITASGNYMYFDNNDGSLRPINYDMTGVKKVVLFNAAETSVTVNEFQLYNLSIPSIPLNLSATSGDSKVDLSWSSVIGATSYTIKRSLTPGGPYVQLASNISNPIYEDTSVVNGTTYYYIVTATNEYGESQNSNEASANPMVNIPDAPSNLTAIGDSEFQVIHLNWNSVVGATYYEVKRSTNEGGPYITISNHLTETSYTDEDVISGTSYYYVVVAVSQGLGSENSNEASASLEEPRRALLTVYISGGQIKDYDLSLADLNSFLDWYDAKDAGTGPAKYAFTKTWNKGPFKSRTEYVIFDKILTFDVDEYEVTNP